MSGHHPTTTAVLFDLDNTLLDQDAGFMRFCRELYQNSAAMNQANTEDEAVALIAFFERRCDGSTADLFRDIMAQWPNVFANIEEAIQVYLSSYPKLLTLHPLTKKLLEDLRDLGTPTAIVTNGSSKMQMLKIEESGLEDLVNTICPHFWGYWRSQTQPSYLRVGAG